MSNDLFLHRHTKAYRRHNPYPLVEVPDEVSTMQWVTSVGRQREAHANQPFLSPLLPISRSSSLSLYTISTLISVGGYKYTGTKVLDYPLYRDRYIITHTGWWDDHTVIGDALSVGDLDDDYLTPTAYARTGLHWEFMKGYSTTTDGAGPMASRQYLYLPIDSYTTSVMELVPTIPYWSEAGPTIGHLVPDRLYLLPSNHMDYGEWYNVGPIGMGTSPFLPGFVSTGVSTIIGDGEVLYEYQDIEGWYSIPGTLYMSPLRPDAHQYPLGRPKAGDLVLDSCVAMGQYPSKATTPWVGVSTGYRTTSQYHPSRTYYLYEDLDGGTFLHDAVPSPNTWPLIGQLLGDGGITISVPCVRDELYIRDKGCGVVIELPDLGEGRYTDGNYWDDCTWIGDTYFMAWDPCITYWNDRLWMDDYQWVDPCVEVGSQCGLPCMWDDVYRFNDETLCEDV
jgi:hypothetical protein